MDRDTYLLHQVHPAKVAVDVAADAVSTWLMWRRHVLAALVAAFLPASLATAVLVRRDLTWMRDTRRGRYVLAHMPGCAQVLRLLGQALAWRAAYQHQATGIAVGHVVIVAGWSHGLLPHTSRSPKPADSV